MSAVDIPLVEEKEGGGRGVEEEGVEGEGGC